MEQQRIEVVGKLGSTYGIRGWLRIYSSTEQAESIFDYQPWFLKIKGEWQPTELENWRQVLFSQRQKVVLTLAIRNVTDLLQLSVLLRLKGFIPTVTPAPAP